MRIIERYIFGRVAVAGLGAFGAILGVVWVTQAVTRIDVATGSAASIAAFLTMMTMLLPQFATLTLPFGLLIGTINVFNAMNTDSEMPVMSGSGLSRWHIARPVLILGIACGLAILLVTNLVEPAANRSVRNIVTESRTDLLATLIQEGRFVQLQPGLTIHVDRKLPGNVLTGVMIADERNNDVKLIQYARQAVVDESTGVPLLLMRDGQIQRINNDTGSVSIVSFDAYALSLAQFTSAKAPQYFLHERNTSYLLHPDPNDPYANGAPGQVAAELHRRMSEWLYAPLFALIALVVAGQTRSHRSTGITTVFLAFATGLGYRWAGYFAYSVTKADGSLFWLLYAIPLVGIAVGIFMFMTGRSVTVPDRLVNLIVRMRRRLPGPAASSDSPAT